MTQPRFQPLPAPLDLTALIALTGAEASGSRTGATVAVTGVATIDWAGPSDLVFFDASGAEPGALEALGRTDAGACLISPEIRSHVPATALALVTKDPRRAFLVVAAALFPKASRPEPMFGPGVAPGATVHAEARLEPDVSIDPGAVIGPGVEIGRGSIIGANAVIGAHVRIGRDSSIGAGATVSNALIGNDVTIHQGASLGHAGLVRDGSTPLGRVIVQDGAEIGANAAIARGRAHDTIIGEASRVDALTRIAADVVIGRHCLVYAALSLAEGAKLGDYALCGLAETSRPPLGDFKA